MSISNEIRALARDGFSTADIARRLGIRYQHAYNVLKADGNSAIPPKAVSVSNECHTGTSVKRKPPLPVDALIAGGFTFASQWLLSSTGSLVLNRRLPESVGVYAFAKGGVVFYVGVATIGLAKRLYFYRKPGASQITNQRLNAIIKDDLQAGQIISVYTAIPPDLEWNGLPIHGSAGLELGLIKKYALPWNMRSAG